MAQTARSAMTWVTAANVETNNPDAFDRLKGTIKPEREKVEAAEADAEAPAEEPKADAKKTTAKKEDTKTEDK